MDNLRLFYINQRDLNNLLEPVQEDFIVVSTRQSVKYATPLVEYSAYQALKDTQSKRTSKFPVHVPSNVTPEEYFKFYCQDEEAIEYFNKYVDKMTEQQSSLSSDNSREYSDLERRLKKVEHAVFK